jgi:hypothetical protein
VQPVPGQADSSPHAEYLRRRDARRQEQARLEGLYRRLARARNAVLGLVVALAWLAEKERPPVRVALLAAPALAFVSFVVRRNRASRAWRRAALAADFYERRLARLEDRWPGSGPAGTRYLDESHPFARDLDLFGAGGLFERLAVPCSRRGEDTLAAWLLHPADAEEVRQRQAAVAELTPRLDLREELAVRSADLPAGGSLEALAAWGRTPAGLPVGVRRAVGALAVLPWAVLTGACVLGAGLVPFLAALVLCRAAGRVLGSRLRGGFADAEAAAPALAPLAGLLERLGRESFAAPRLTQLAAVLAGPGGPAPRHLARLGRLLRRAPLVALLGGRAAPEVAAEVWRRHWGPALGGWLVALGEVEALCALAACAFENPADPFPEVIAEGPCFDAEGVGHPLLAHESCVANDVCLAGELRLLVVSGSNMSGKSTLLRTVGVNAVLALAGAPVRARRLRLSPLVVGATLRIQDSLRAGRSRFWAEVLRVRQLLDLARGSPPLLFLLDELFQGTNSHDRQRGAEAVLRRLVEAGAVGLVTTHDLALAQTADLLAPRAANVHFEDRFEDGALTFDYRMRPGVVRSSNGLALLRAVGIEV